MESPLVVADAIEAQEFPELAARHGVMGVPKTIVNGAVEFVGAVPEDEFVANVLRGAGV